MRFRKHEGAASIFDVLFRDDPLFGTSCDPGVPNTPLMSGRNVAGRLYSECYARGVEDVWNAELGETCLQGRFG